MARSTQRALGGIGAVLTCPCHVVPLVLLFGGTAGTVWLARHLPLLVAALVTVFGASLWLLLRSAPAAGVASCDADEPKRPHDLSPA